MSTVKYCKKTGLVMYHPPGILPFKENPEAISAFKKHLLSLPKYIYYTLDIEGLVNYSVIFYRDSNECRLTYNLPDKLFTGRTVTSVVDLFIEYLKNDSRTDRSVPDSPTNNREGTH